MKLRPSAVQVEEPASGCDINTIARDTVIEFILRPRAGSLTCSVNGYSFILSMFAFEKCRDRSYLSSHSYLCSLHKNLVLFHNFFL